MTLLLLLKYSLVLSVWCYSLICVSQVSQPALANPCWVWTHHGPGCDLHAAELQKAALPPPGELCPYYRWQPEGCGGSRRQSAGGKGGLLQEHHSGRAAGCQREEAQHPAKCGAERIYDPRQKAWGDGATQDCTAEAVVMRETLWHLFSWTTRDYITRLLIPYLCVIMFLYVL